jgi:hypothetical protein
MSVYNLMASGTLTMSNKTLASLSVTGTLCCTSNATVVGKVCGLKLARGQRAVMDGGTAHSLHRSLNSLCIQPLSLKDGWRVSSRAYRGTSWGGAGLSVQDAANSELKDASTLTLFTYATTVPGDVTTCQVELGIAGAVSASTVSAPDFYLNGVGLGDYLAGVDQSITDLTAAASMNGVVGALHALSAAWDLGGAA